MTTTFAACVVTTTFFVSTLAPASSEDGRQEPLPLAAASLQLADMAATDQLHYTFKAQSDQPYLLEIDQGGFDLKVEMTLPSGDAQLFDFPTYRDETEVLLIEPTGEDTVSIRVFTEEFTGARAAPRLTLTKATASEGHLSAWRLLNEASKNYAAYEIEAAIDNLSAGCEQLRIVGESRQLARCLFGLANLKAWEVYEYDEADQAAMAAGALYGKLDLRRTQANTQELRGVVMVEIATIVEKTPGKGIAPEARLIFAQALELLRQAEQEYLHSDDPFRAARARNLIGYAHYHMTDYAAALVHYRDAANAFRALDEWQSEMMPVSNIAVIDFDRGYLISAIEAWERSLQLLPPETSKEDRAYLLNNIGAAYLALGQTDLALEHHSIALALSREIGERSEEGHALNGIGMVYVAIGETELGMEYLEMALTVRRETSDGRGIVSALNALGQLYLERGDIQAALTAHREAESIATSPRDKARTQLRLSEDLVKAGKPLEALVVLRSAGESAREKRLITLEADSHRLLGDASLAAEDYYAAIRAYQNAATIYREQLLVAELSRCEYGLSRSHAAAGNAEQAVAHARAAIEAIETMRNRLATPQLRAFFLGSRQDYFAQLINALLALAKSGPGPADTYIREALEISEQARARALLDLVSETAPSDDGGAWSSRRNDLYRVLADTRYRLDKLQDEPPTPARAIEISSARQVLAETENALNLLEIEQRNRDPAYARLTDPPILDAESIQAMLEPDMMLLQYSLGDAASNVFMVTHHGIRVWPLPVRAQIEMQARNLYKGFSEPATTHQGRVQFQADLAAFSNLVLPPDIGPLHQRLIIVADGVLQYLPFAALLSAGELIEHEALLENHLVVSLPSLSALAAIRQQAERNGRPDREIALVADPVFSTADGRFAALDNPVSVSEPPDPLFHPAEPLQRLPATALEAQAIAGLVEPEQTLIATGFDASRKTVLESGLDHFRIVHFATHGLIDSRYPALSALAFSQFDRQGDALEGMLRLHDIYNMQLNAELVTLSACSTALGREISGEGLTGLTQGFMHAGSRAVLASLWQVPDRATSELMKRFYLNLLEQEQAPAEALRNAQLDLAEQARWKHPYYWSGFILQGDWK